MLYGVKVSAEEAIKGVSPLQHPFVSLPGDDDDVGGCFYFQSLLELDANFSFSVDEATCIYIYMCVCFKHSEWHWK